MTLTLSRFTRATGQNEELGMLPMEKHVHHNQARVSKGSKNHDYKMQTLGYLEGFVSEFSFLCSYSVSPAAWNLGTSVRKAYDSY